MGLLLNSFNNLIDQSRVNTSYIEAHYKRKKNMSHAEGKGHKSVEKTRILVFMVKRSMNLLRNQINLQKYAFFVPAEQQ